MIDHDLPDFRNGIVRSGGQHLPIRRGAGPRLISKLDSLYHCISMRMTVTLDDDVFEAAGSPQGAAALLQQLTGQATLFRLRGSPVSEVRNGLCRVLRAA